MSFRDLSLRRKLTLLLMTAAATAVLLSSAVVYVLTIRHFRRAYEDDLTSLARVVGNNCSAALAFRVPEDAWQVLSSLSEKPSVIQAVLRDSRGAVFAAHGRQPGAPDDPPPGGSGHLRIVREIALNGEVLGSLTLVDDMRGLDRTRLLAGFVFALSVSVALLVAFVLARYLQRFISKPILELSSAADRISRESDPSIRVARLGNDEVGRLVDAFNTMVDRLERRNRELTDSERRFRTLVDQAVDAFLLFDPEGRIVDVNEMACATLGYRREELLARGIHDITAAPGCDPATSAPPALPWPPALLPAPRTIETWHRRKDGTVFPVEMRLGNLELGGGAFIMGLARDISERSEANREKLKLEAQLRQAQKMEAIGTLAGGIAHDFNNLLGVIFGHAELIRYKLPPESPFLPNVDGVLKAGSRARDLVAQILAFSRQTEQQRKPLLPQPIVREALKMLRSSLPATIEIRESIQACNPVLSDPTQIHQIVMNLCTNAFHAMREKGTGVLGVSLAPVTIGADARPGELRLLAPGRYVKLEVSDTGCGMDRLTIEKIFDPYFTTKAKGEGTGLGLAVVHGIVRSHGGRIGVYSEPGVGSTFSVYLPECEAPRDLRGLVGPDDLIPAEEALPGGAERVLLVDDEEEIIEVVQAMLATLGYRVEAHTDPAAALRAFSRSPAAYDLLLTDMTMPGLSGDRLARRFLELRPDFPVVLCTGFSEIIDGERARGIGIREFVMKPVLKADLARAVRRALDRR